MKIDPATGKPVEEADKKQQQPNYVQITPEEWAATKTKLDMFEKLGFNQQPQQSNQPSTPTGPSLEDQIKPLEQKIIGIDQRIDELVQAGKPVGNLLQERSRLDRQITRLEIKHNDIDPAFSTGVATINQLSDQVTRGGMKYLDIVRTDYDQVLSMLPADQQMSPEIRKQAYDIAVGKNVDKILSAQQEEILRNAAQQQTNDLPANVSRSGAGDPDKGIPAPESVLKQGSLDAIRSQGLTPDQYYQRRGYQGWNDYWEKTGKAYFEPTIQ